LGCRRMGLRRGRLVLVLLLLLLLLLLWVLRQL
jgi:hypothetical protein